MKKIKYGLGKKVFSGYLISIVLLVLFSVLSMSNMKSITERFDAVNSDYTSNCIDIGTFSSNHQELESYLNQLVYGGESSSTLVTTSEKQIDTLAEKCNTMLDKIIANVSDESTLSELNSIKDDISQESGYYTQIKSYIVAKQYAQAKSLYEGSVDNLEKGIDQNIEDAVSILKDKSDTEIASVDSFAAGIRIKAFVGSCGACVIILVMAGLFSQYIQGPIKQLTVMAEQVADGNVNIEEIKKRTNDEVGMLIESFDRMIHKLQAEADIAKSVAKGDLSMDVKPKSEHDELGKAFKKLVDANNMTLGNIRESAYQVGAGAQQVAIASQSLAQGSTEQASSIQQVTASISDITERTKANATDAGKAESLVRQAKDDAEAGTREMEKMMGAMQDISESSENISKIIKTIDDIAFQTNILALNAAVEAARAGEHGKGFAVVAEEVRNLAAKSAAAASETAEMIENSIEKTQNGSAIASGTSEKLSTIATNVEEIVKIVVDIAAASNDQASALAQVDQAVMQVSTVIQNNSATSEQCAAASEELSNQAQNLKDLIGKYNLKKTVMHDNYIGNAPAHTDRFISGNTNTNINANANINAIPVNNAAPSAGYVHKIPDASEFAATNNYSQNENIISLEDNGYSKY